MDAITDDTYLMPYTGWAIDMPQASMLCLFLRPLYKYIYGHSHLYRYSNIQLNDRFTYGAHDDFGNQSYV